MKQKFFKYETRSGKKIRVKDLLMLFSVFVLCIITVIVSGTAVNKKLKVNKNITENSENVSNVDAISQSDNIQKQANNNTQNSDQINEVYEFSKPVDGGIIKPFSPDELIYSETMDDWRTHMGVDISCPYGTQITSSEKGTVVDVFYDINFGNTVIIRSGEYEHIYSSLSADVFVEKGQNVNKGDIIGFSSDTCISEICDDPHIHFEIKKNGIYVDPFNLIHFN